MHKCTYVILFMHRPAYMSESGVVVVMVFNVLMLLDKN